MPLYYPGTTTLVTQSFADRLKVAEFDDALVDQAPWKNPRYDGSKLHAKKINEYTQFDEEKYNPVGSFQVGSFPVGLSGSLIRWAGDSPHPGGLSPIISNKTTAVYIANTVIGGTEDPQFATIKDHSYLGIDRILLINQEDDTVELINKSVEGFDEFHRFITNDFPTGGNFGIKLLDGTIQSNLKQNYKVKMNKGYLLKSFDFTFASSSGDKHLAQNNSIYLFRSGGLTTRQYHTGSVSTNSSVIQDGKLRFRYAVNQVFPPGISGTGQRFNINKTGPSFASSSIFENKFTKQYYSGSFGFIFDNPNGATDSQILKNSGLGSASKFISFNTLDFLRKDAENTSSLSYEKTELHITFFEGTKDFAPGKHDERSIGTFEVDSSIGRHYSLGGQEGIGDECNGFLPHKFELVFKGINDTRFEPTTQTYIDDISSGYIESTASSGVNGCPSQGNAGFAGTYKGVSVDYLDNGDFYIQGGALGPQGNQDALTGSGTPITDSFNLEDNGYSGSFKYQLSFLDKDHTIITNLNKDNELFDGIGDKEIILIPDNLTQNIKSNLEFYLKKAGLIDTAPVTKAPINTNQPSNPTNPAF